MTTDTVNKKTINIYYEEVEVPLPLRTYLVSCYKNHLVIYNDMLEYYRRNRYTQYKELKTKLVEVLENNVYLPVINTVIHADIYYMVKKKDFKQKLLTDIQYISVISRGYKFNKVFRYDQETLRLYVGESQCAIELKEPLPEVEEDQNVYINLSYSGSSGVFELSVFTGIS